MDKSIKNLEKQEIVVTIYNHTDLAGTMHFRSISSFHNWLQEKDVKILKKEPHSENTVEYFTETGSFIIEPIFWEAE